MAESVFWRNEEVTENMDFDVWQCSKSRVWLAPIFRTRLAEKQAEEDRQLQSVMRLTQTQWLVINNGKIENLLSSCTALHKIANRFLLKYYPRLTLELFYEMAESAFWRDEQVRTNEAFQVMAKSKIPDMTGSNISSTAGRKTTARRKTQTTAKSYAFHANAIKRKV